MDDNMEKAGLMLDLKAFLEEFSCYSPESEGLLNSRSKELKTAYKDMKNSEKIISAVKSYVLLKYEERMIRDGYYRKIEKDFFDGIVSALCDGTPLPDQEEYMLPLTSDSYGNPQRYTHFAADKLIPFITEKMSGQ